MKNTKIFLYSLFALLAVSSCSLEKYPYDAIDTENAMQSVSDVENFRTGLYATTKNCFTGAFVIVPDIQADCYHAVDRFNGDYRAFYGYTLLASEGVCNNTWYGLYGFIANANFMIDGARKLMAAADLSRTDREKLELYYGEGCYLRAHIYYLLTEYFCRDFDPATADEGDTGVFVVTKYNPSSNSSTYPGRGSLKTTYAQILADLAEAETYVTTPGEQNSPYVTADVVKALQARVALAMHDYDTAFKKAKDLIDSGTYPLMSDGEAYARGWMEDNLTETLWQPVMLDRTDVGNSAKLFINNSFGTEGDDKPQYVPEDWVLGLYDRENDIRYDAYFEERTFSQPVAGTMTLLVKYPGNPKYNSDSGKVPAYINQPKVFRISEMYLLAAEAASNLAGQESVASYYLNELKRKRIAGWTDIAYSGTRLRDEIRSERVRELFGEGHRLNDLKRWHIGFSRSEGQNPDLLYPGENYVTGSRPADDPLFLWPIPTTEVQANPRMVQNPGYTRN